MTTPTKTTGIERAKIAALIDEGIILAARVIAEGPGGYSDEGRTYWVELLRRLSWAREAV